MSENEARFDRFDDLEVQVFADAAGLGAAAAADAAAVIEVAVTETDTANVMLATGNSQLTFLDALATLVGIPWPRVRIFHMDEYVGLSADHPASFARYIRTRVTERVRPLEAHYLNPTTDLTAAADEAARYAGLLHRQPIDLCVMGIGENGHLAFNDPGVADFHDPLDVKVVALDEVCRSQQVGEGHFASLDEVPTHAITVTIPALLRASRIIVVCPEARKAAAVREALCGPIATSCPASILRSQPHARLYLETESAKELPTKQLPAR